MPRIASGAVAAAPVDDQGGGESARGQADDRTRPDRSTLVAMWSVVVLIALLATAFVIWQVQPTKPLAEETSPSDRRAAWKANSTPAGDQVRPERATPSPSDPLVEHDASPAAVKVSEASVAPGAAPTDGVVASASGDQPIATESPPAADTSTSKIDHQFAKLAASVTNLAFSVDGQQLLSSSVDGSVRLWDFDSATTLATQPGTFADFVPGPGQILAVLDGGLQLYDARLASVVSAIPTAPEPIQQFYIDRAGSFAVSFEPYNSRLIDLAHKQELPPPWKHERSSLSGPGFRMGGQSGPAMAAVLGSDARHLITAHQDQQGHVDHLYFFDRLAKSGQFVAVKMDSEARAYPTCLALSHDGKLLATGHTASKEYVVDLFAWNRTHNMAQSATRKGTRNGDVIQLWDVATRRRITTLFDAHPGGVTALDFSRDGRLLASGGASGSVALWTLDGYRLTARYAEQSSPVTVVRLSPDCQSVAIGYVGESTKSDASHDPRGTIEVWRVAAESIAGRDVSRGPASNSIDEVIEFHRHARPVQFVMSDPSGSRLLSCDGVGNVKLWNANSGGQLLEFTPLRLNFVKTMESVVGGFFAGAFSRSGEKLLLGSKSGVFVGQTATGEGTVFAKTSLNDTPPPPSPPKRKTRKRPPQETETPPAPNAAIDLSWPVTLRFSDDEKSFLCATRGAGSFVGGNLVRVDYANAQTLAFYNPHAVLPRDGIPSFYGGPGGTVVSPESLNRWFASQRQSVVAGAISADGKTWLIGHENGFVSRWDTVNRNFVKALGQHHQPVARIQLAQDDRQAMSLANDGVRIWNLDENAQSHWLTKPGMRFDAAALSPNGLWVASANGDKLLLWNLQDGTCRELATAPAKLTCLEFAPDSASVFAGRSDGAIARQPIGASSNAE